KQFSDGRFDRHPAKDHASHLMNCLAGDTLIETRRGSVPISAVTTQDQVWTRKGWRRVLASWQSGEREVCEVIFSDGRNLVCTPDHLIWADSKWTQAYKLQYKKVCHERKSPITESFTIGTQSQKTARIGSIFGEGPGELIAGCTSLSGKRQTDLFPK